MKRYSLEVKNKVKSLRSSGNTYSEIRKKIGINFPKSTLSGLCKGVVLPADYVDKVGKINFENLSRARSGAWAVNKIKREKFLESLDRINEPIALKVREKSVAKVALAMLCLGEATKYGTGSAFSLGSSNPKIIILFLFWLKQCFDFKEEKVRCTVQCRADQDVPELEKYWQNITGFPKHLFYQARIDPRTVGKPTRKLGYKGVLKIDYFDTKVQLELESLVKLVYNKAIIRARSIPVERLRGTE